MGEITEAVISNPKTSLAVVALTNFSNWWVDWGNPIISAAASILGVVLLLVLIRYHLHNTKALIANTKNKADEKESP